jgi:cytochrome c5
MLKYSLITALLAFSGLMANAQTTAAPAAASASASAKAPAKAATSARATPAAKPAAATGPEVKKSKAGICHEKASTGYKQTKNFTEFKTLDECIKSGGRAAKK